MSHEGRPHGSPAPETPLWIYKYKYIYISVIDTYIVLYGYIYICGIMLCPVYGYIVYIYISGWWLIYPSEKYEFVSLDDEIPMPFGKIKFMFQTTNQSIVKYHQLSLKYHQ